MAAGGTGVTNSSSSTQLVVLAPMTSGWPVVWPLAIQLS